MAGADIIFYGRGGQAAVTGAEILQQAVFKLGKNFQLMPHITAAQKGGDTKTFLRVSDEKIIKSCFIYHPDVVLAFYGENLLSMVSGIKSGGWLIVNSVSVPDEIHYLLANAAVVNANRISRELKLGQAINTIMLGAFSRATGLVPFEVIAEIVPYFVPRKKEENLKALERGFEEVKIVFGPRRVS